ncbi:helix-turn-helix transcriptional regulator [Oleiharenicola lentus]|uniref:helix-turn-helix transcriptional regulator n=1 Tax=Oleiharenicola lentus TaxID=2508720 RepID=UPI003F66622D
MSFTPLENRIDSSSKAATSGSFLQHLTWSARSETAPAFSKRGSWNYVVIESGSVQIVRGASSQLIAVPALVVIGPDCAVTWRHEPMDPVKHLGWIWARPAHPALGPLRRDMCAHYGLAGEDLAELRQLHASSRSEVHRGDLHSGQALTGLQFLLETRIARIVESGGGDRSNEVVERALGWIQSHVATRQPLARLADFLGVSPATVQRMFRQRLGTTVMKSVAETRLREAERMLGLDGVSIKEVAYHLGYRHPHDFSRAFRNYTGQLPSRWEGTAETAGSARKRGAACVELMAGHS